MPARRKVRGCVVQRAVQCSMQCSVACSVVQCRRITAEQENLKRIIHASKKGGKRLCSAVQCSVVQCAVQCSVVQHAVQCSVVQCRVVQCRRITAEQENLKRIIHASKKEGVVQCSVVQCSVVQRSVVQQCSVAVQCSSVQQIMSWGRQLFLRVWRNP